MEESMIKLTQWANEPTVTDLNQDLLNSKDYHSEQVNRINSYLENLKAPPIKIGDPKKAKTHSTIQPKLIRKQAEWRYSALSEAFLTASTVFKINPITYEDGYSARQNELVLNYQFNTQIDKVKLIDEYVRCAVDTGTAIFRVGWEELEDTKDIPVPQYNVEPVDPNDLVTMARFQRISKAMQDTIYISNVPDQWKQCIQRAQQETQMREQEVFQQIQQQIEFLGSQLPPEELEQVQQQLLEQAQQYLQQLPPIAYQPIEAGTIFNRVTKTINRPTIELCNFRDIYIDPTCEGDIDKAEFIIYRFTSCKADLMKDGRYYNVELIPESNTMDYEDIDYIHDNSKDPNRKKLNVYEYWGNWDIKGDGTKTPIVATWCNNTMIRLEENPYPDHKPPFVFVSYLPIVKSLYGEPDGALLADNQKIIGAVTRGVIDLLAKSANSQTGMAIQFLDPINEKAFNEGRDYKFNPTMQPQQAIFQHAYPDIPQWILQFIQTQEFEAEALTGVKGFSQGIDGSTLGETAAGVRGVLDAASKREMGILRRLANGLKQVARKILAMNALWLNEREIIRITNQDFVEVRRDDLAGNFDLELAISSPEDDTAKAESLAFMLQTLGNTVDQGMTQMILSEICKLKRMPELAERVARFEPPQPDPMQQQLAEMQLQMLQAQIQKLEAEVQKIGADAQLSGAKAQTEMINAQVDAQMRPIEAQAKLMAEQGKAALNQAQAKKLDLEYFNELSGTKHREEMELMAQQAKAQMEKSLQEKYADWQMSQMKDNMDLQKFMAQLQMQDQHKALDYQMNKEKLDLEREKIKNTSKDKGLDYLISQEKTKQEEIKASKPKTQSKSKKGTL